MAMAMEGVGGGNDDDADKVHESGMRLGLS